MRLHLLSKKRVPPSRTFQMVLKSSRQISQKLSLHYDAVWFKLQESSSQVIQFSTEFLFVVEVFRKLLEGLLIRGALCPFLFLIGEWIHSRAVGFPSTRIVILAVTLPLHCHNCHAVIFICTLFIFVRNILTNLF